MNVRDKYVARNDADPFLGQKDSVWCTGTHGTRLDYLTFSHVDGKSRPHDVMWGCWETRWKPKIYLTDMCPGG